MDKDKLQVLFKDEILKDIDKLKEDSGAVSRADVVRDAIRLYKSLNDLTSIKGAESVLCCPHKKFNVRRIG